jgi:hypothetical protein
MTSIREQLAAKILAEFGATKVDVKPYGAQPSELRRPMVVVFRGEVDQGQDNLVHSFTVQVMAPQGVPDQDTEDALDGLLDTVLTALRRLDVVAWSKATRKVFLDAFQGWEIEVTWASVDVYKQAI